MKKRNIVDMAVGCALLAAGVWPGESARAGKPETVRNPISAIPGVDVLPTTELWRFGEDSHGDEGIYGTVVDVAFDDGGQSVYVLVSDACHILVFDGHGQITRTVGTCGEGPGELSSPAGIELVPDGIVVQNMNMGRPLVFINRDGTQRNHSPGDAISDGWVDNLYGVEDGLWLSQTRLNRTASGFESVERIVKIGFDGDVLAEPYTSRNTAVTPDGLASGIAAWCIGSNGNIWMNTTDDTWIIQVFRPDGKPLRTIEREFHRSRYSESIREQARANAAHSGIPFDLPEFPPVIQRLERRSDGSIWVTVAAAAESGRWNIGPLDVVSARGRVVRTIELQLPGGASPDNYWISGNRIVCQVAPENSGGELTAPAILCLSFDPESKGIRKESINATREEQ